MALSTINTNSIADDAVTVPKVTDQVLTHRNRIINGAMTIDQRNAGASVTPTNGSYQLDRWKHELSQASKFTVQQSTVAPDGFYNSMLVTSTSAYSVGASDYFDLFQWVEGFNWSDITYGTATAKTVTLSFWVRSSLTGAFGGALTNSAQNYSYPFTYTISVADTWEQKSITIAGPTAGTWLATTNRGVGVFFSLGMGSNFSGTAGSWSANQYYSATGAVSVVGTSGATFYITGVQLEAGDTATPFEHRSYGDELARCKRYFERFERQRPGAGSAGTTSLWAGPARSGASNVQGPMHYVEKRNNPTISVSSAGHLNAIYPISPFNAALSGFGIDGNAGTQSAYINATGSGSPGSDCASFVYIGDAAGYLDIDAEL